MKAIIIGANGQDGIYLQKLLKREEIDVFCISRSGFCIVGDVGNYEFINTQIENIRPDYIFVFAANSTTSHSALFENHETISTGTFNVLEAVKQHCPQAKVFLSGSAMQFRNDGSPINEETPFDASSPYSISRIHSTYIARYYREKFGLKIYVGYLFNHDSPLRSERHVNQKIVASVKRIREGSQEIIELGNINVNKEFNYAGDIVQAVWILVNQDMVFEAVIGSGETHSIQEWVQVCFQIIGKNWSSYIRIGDRFVPEYLSLVSDPRRIVSLGWKRKVNFAQLAHLMMKKMR